MIDLNFGTTIKLFAALLIPGTLGAVAARVTVGGAELAAYEAEVAPTALADGCIQCSERDLGYRWASAQRIASSSACGDQSWGFRSGCVTWLNERR